MLIGQNILDCVTACVVAAVDPLGGRRVDIEHGIGGQRVDDLVDAVGRARVQTGGDGAYRTDERNAAGRKDQVGAVHGDRNADAGEAVGAHREPDGARRAVLRSRDQALRDAAQLTAGIDIDVVETIGHFWLLSAL